MLTNRYNLPNIIKTSNIGKKVYKTILYPTILPSENDIYIFSKQGDRLDLLAYKYYGDATQWWIIAHANKIKGTLSVPADIQLVIPADINKIYNNLVELNS